MYQSTVSNPTFTFVISETSAEIYVFFKFPIERMSLSIQSVQNVLTHTGRASHWAPEMSWYSTSSFVSIVTLDCKSFMFRALGSADVKRVLSKLFLELQQCLLNLEARLIPWGIISIFNYIFQSIVRFIKIHTIFTMSSGFIILYINSPYFISSTTHFVIRGIFISVNDISYTFTILSLPFP